MEKIVNANYYNKTKKVQK